VPAPAPTTSTTTTKSDAGLAVQPMAAETPALPRLRLVRASASAGLRTGRVEGVGEWFATGPAADAEVELDASDTGRVRLGPDSQFWAVELARGSMLLVSGRARVQVLPDAPRPGRSLLRLATPQGTLRVAGTSEFWVAVRSNKDRAFVALQLLQGELELLRPEQKPLQLTLAQSTYGPLPLQVGVSRTDAEALVALAKGLAHAREQPALREADRQLRERGAELLARVSPSHAHKLPDASPAPKPRSTEEIRAYQHDLAEYARAKSEASELLLLAAERSLLATLLACPAALDCPALQRWQERFSGGRGLILDR
jgi:hypothetical protein